MKKKGSPRSRQTPTVSVVRMKLKVSRRGLLKTEVVARLMKAIIFRKP